jgi:Flp pilus assembly protein TadG
LKISGKLKSRIRDERGSATVEFVALALPLFIPLFLYLNSYATRSDLESSFRTLSREMARAIVTAENDVIARNASAELFTKGGAVLGLGQKIREGSIRYEISCRVKPCISPDNEIQVSIWSSEIEGVVTSVEYVSPWA